MKRKIYTWRNAKHYQCNLQCNQTICIIDCHIRTALYKALFGTDGSWYEAGLKNVWNGSTRYQSFSGRVYLWVFVYMYVCMHMHTELCVCCTVEKVANESQKTPRDVVMMENFHHIFSTLSRLKISCLEAERREAKQKYTEHLQAYVINSLGQPLEKLNVRWPGSSIRGLGDEDISGRVVLC